MKTRIPALGLVAAALTLTLAACGGGADRPTTDEISESLQSGGAADMIGLGSGDLPEEVTDCMAKALHDSDVSDETLNALVDGDEDYQGSDDDADALADLSSQMTECAPTAG